MSKSIMQEERRCYISGKVGELHRHHIYEGSGRRKKSELFGCWVWLTPELHNMSDRGVHFNKELDLKLKQECQIKWEETYGNREAFIREFGRSYL